MDRNSKLRRQQRIAFHLVEGHDGTLLHGVLEVVRCGFAKEDPHYWHAFVTHPSDPGAVSCLAGESIKSIRYDDLKTFAMNDEGKFVEVWPESAALMEALSSAPAPSKEDILKRLDEWEGAGRPMDPEKYGWLASPGSILKAVETPRDEA